MTYDWHRREREGWRERERGGERERERGGEREKGEGRKERGDLWNIDQQSVIPGLLKSVTETVLKLKHELLLLLFLLIMFS